MSAIGIFIFVVLLLAGIAVLAGALRAALDDDAKIALFYAIIGIGIFAGAMFVLGADTREMSKGYPAETAFLGTGEVFTTTEAPEGVWVETENGPRFIAQEGAPEDTTHVIVSQDGDLGEYTPPMPDESDD